VGCSRDTQSFTPLRILHPLLLNLQAYSSTDVLYRYSLAKAGAENRGRSWLQGISNDKNTNASLEQQYSQAFAAPHTVQYQKLKAAAGRVLVTASGSLATPLRAASGNGMNPI
jgi:hypothetical protein